MPSVKELRERRGSIDAKCKEIIQRAENEDRNLTAEENATFTQLHNDDLALKARIDRIESQEKRSKELDELVTDPDRMRGAVNRNDDEHGRESNPRAQRHAMRERAVGSWARAAVGMRLSQKERKEIQAVGFRGQKTIGAKFSKTAKLRETIARVNQAMTTHTVATGASLIPTGFMNRLETAMSAFGGMLNVSEVITTDGGGDLPWPTLNDTSNEGVEIAESEETGAQDPTLGGMTLHDYKYTTKEVVVPTELFEDSPIDVAGVLGDLLGERAGRIMNRRCTTGDGAARPFGVLTRSVAGPTTASATAITADELLDLIHSVDPAYRPQSSLMFHDNVLLVLRKLKGSDNQYLWQPGFSAGVADRIAGYPYTINQHMASSVAANAKTVLFGDFRKYKIRIVRSLRIQRFNEIFGRKDQVAFVGFFRFDGDLLNAGGNPIKHLLQHA